VDYAASLERRRCWFQSRSIDPRVKRSDEREKGRDVMTSHELGSDQPAGNRRESFPRKLLRDVAVSVLANLITVVILYIYGRATGIIRAVPGENLFALGAFAFVIGSTLLLATFSTMDDEKTGFGNAFVGMALTFAIIVAAGASFWVAVWLVFLVVRAILRAVF
jgi:hypothetical protein